MKIENGLYMLLGAASVRLHTGVLENGDGPLLTSWLGTCRKDAFDVVGNEEWPNQTQPAIQLGLHGEHGIVTLLHSLGLLDSAKSTGHIYYDKGQWVGYDEAGLEYCRDTNYLKVRAEIHAYCEVLDVPLDGRIPASGETWKHSNGNEYVIDKLANQYSDRAEYPPTVVYQGANGKVWSKTLLNFLRKMTYVSSPEPVACGQLSIPGLDIVGVRKGNTWPANEAEDSTPQADIDLEYSKGSKLCASSDRMWYGAVLVNGQTMEHAEELRDMVVEGLKVVTGNTCEEEGCPHYGTPHAHSKPLQPVDQDGEPFAQDQWWVTELENVLYSQPVTKDQARACRVALNLVKSVLPITVVMPQMDDEAKQKFIEAWSAVDHSRTKLIGLDPQDHMYDRFTKQPD
jgi:hypothetical protein